MNYDESINKTLKAISDSANLAIQRANMDALAQAINLVSSAFDIVNEYDSVLDTVSKSLKQQYMQIDALLSYSSIMINEMAELQASVALAASVYHSTMIQNVAKSIAQMNIQACVLAIQDAVDKPYISMPDYSFLKTTQIMKEVQNEVLLPYGFKTDLKKFNKSSAKQLSNNDELYYHSDKRAFFVGNYSASIQEMNSICSAVRFLDDVGGGELFSEIQLVDFMSFLEKTPKAGMNHSTGARINTLIHNMKDFICFDNEFYYHSRPREKTAAPFVWSQMLQAPYGVSSVGRYNDLGQSHFYFTDAEQGSISEILKHIDKSEYDKYVIQTVEISAHNPIKLIDLSSKEKRRLNTFLKFIRFTPNNESGRRPREYLIPQFVADCCICNGIDGIKYYGGKDYSNYVTWDDHYYKYERNVGDTQCGKS